MLAILNKCNLEKNILKANNICLDLLRSLDRNNRVLRSSTRFIGGGAAALILQNVGATRKSDGGVLQYANSAENYTDRIYHEKNIEPKTKPSEVRLPRGGVTRRPHASVA